MSKGFRGCTNVKLSIKIMYLKWQIEYDESNRERTS